MQGEAEGDRLEAQETDRIGFKVNIQNKYGHNTTERKSKAYITKHCKKEKRGVTINGGETG